MEKRALHTASIKHGFQITVVTASSKYDVDVR